MLHCKYQQLHSIRPDDGSCSPTLLMSTKWGRFIWCYAFSLFILYRQKKKLVSIFFHFQNQKKLWICGYLILTWEKRQFWNSTRFGFKYCGQEAKAFNYFLKVIFYFIYISNLDTTNSHTQSNSHFSCEQENKGEGRSGMSPFRLFIMCDDVILQ